MIDLSKMGVQGFGTAYGSQQMAAAPPAAPQPPDGNSQVYNTQKKTSITQKPDGTTSKSTTESGGSPMYNPNSQIPYGYSGFQQPAGMGQAQGAWQNILNDQGGAGYLNAFNNSFMPGMQYTINDAINQAMQKGSNMGMLNSAPMQRMQGDIAARAWAGIAPQLAQVNLGEYGNAMNRYMQGAQGMENNAMNQFGLGQTWANNAMNMGNAYQNQQTGMLGQYQNEMARMRGENNPYYNLSLQGMNAQNQVGPVQYQPSPFAQGLNMMGGLGMASLMGGGGLIPKF